MQPQALSWTSSNGLYGSSHTSLYATADKIFCGLNIPAMSNVGAI